MRATATAWRAAARTTSAASSASPEGHQGQHLGAHDNLGTPRDDNNQRQEDTVTAAAKQPFQQPFHDEDTATPLTSVPVPVVVTDYQAWCLLTSAFEGGSNYWIARVETVGGKKAKGREFVQDEPFLGGTLIVHLNDPGDREGGTIPLTRESMAVGLAVMARVCPRQFAHVTSDGGDADTGDCFLQCCVLGEVMYG